VDEEVWEDSGYLGETELGNTTFTILVIQDCHRVRSKHIIYLRGWACLFLSFFPG